MPRTVDLTISIPQASLLELVSAEVHASPEYARAWHNAVVRSCVDEGMTNLPLAAKIAARFMVEVFALDSEAAAKITVGKPIDPGAVILPSGAAADFVDRLGEGN